jgi:GT2 family glycosyltransferase
MPHDLAAPADRLRDGLWQDRILMVIPSVGGGDLLARMLPTLRFRPSNIIVLDQGSTDDTAAVCRRAGVEMMQLGQPHTYTQACNIGAHIARERGYAYLCVSNNDIVFKTDVLAELFAEMERDPSLGISAPSQVVVDEARGQRQLCYRVFWNLGSVEFLHDMQGVAGAPRRLEADFCELTCAVVRMSAIERVGFLDDAYGFYHEDADFGFRLRKAGYGCAYLPQSQIDHFSGSTFRREEMARKSAYVASNKIHFARKHLGYGVGHQPGGEMPVSEQDAFNRNMHLYLRRFGLLDGHAPELIVGCPGVETTDYLYTNFRASRLPARWTEYNSKYRAIFTTSADMRLRFSGLGITNCFHVPVGIEPDVFHPWGPTRRLYDEMTYLAVVDGSHDPQLRLILEAWHCFTRTNHTARLVMMGPGLGNCMGYGPDTLHRSGNLDIARYREQRIDIYDAVARPTDHDLAQLYRGVDFTVLDPSGHGPTLSALESMACGVPSIFDPAIGQGQTTDDLLAGFKGSIRLSARERAALGEAAAYRVRGSSTLRHTAMGLYEALIHLQDQNPARTVKMLERNQAALILAISGPGRVIASPLTKRPLSYRAAERVKAVGQLTTLFGSVWQDNGLPTAGRMASRRLWSFASRRWHRVVRTGAGALRQAHADLRRVMARFVRLSEPRQNSALLIGYIDAQLGLGQSLRGLALAMSRTPVRFSIYPFGVGVEGRRSVPYMPERYDLVNAHAVNVIEVTPDELPKVFEHVSERFFDRSYNILRTYWELGKAPEAWRACLAPIDEIWAPNPFVAESFRTIFDRPITVVPPCIDLPRPAPGEHNRFGLDEERFHFLFSFDYFSFPQRKNPLAVVRAFRAAFPDLSAPVGLIVKSSGAVTHFQHIKEALRAAARHDPRIQIIDESLPRDEMLILMATADCYVSLHRSEGFGLGMAEAMALGKPVIGTGYSGNTDFLNEETGYPIPYVLRAVAADEYVHTEGQVWAEPDEAACAIAMRRVFGNRTEAAAKATAGQRLVAERYGSVNVGRVVETRLNQVFDLGRR